MNEIIMDYLKGVKPKRVSAKDMEWSQAWGAEVFGKKLVAKEEGLPFSVILKRFPKQKEVVKEGGYVVHAHPTLEIGFVTKGKFKVYFEDVGVIEVATGTLLVQPAGLKHAVVSVDEDSEILAINIPAAEWEEQKT